jgi:hypothetical protein
MLQLLDDVLKKVPQLTLERREISMSLIDVYRREAFALMRELCSTEETFSEFVNSRHVLWRHVYNTLRTPCEWDNDWERPLGTDAENNFLGQRIDRWGEVKQVADRFRNSVAALRRLGENPMRTVFVELLRDTLFEKTVAVLIPRSRDIHLFPVGDGCLAKDTLLTESALRRVVECRDVLVTFGRNDHDTPYHIVSAPKWHRIINLRWSGDDDDEAAFPAFPELIAVQGGDVASWVNVLPVQKIQCEVPPSITAQDNTDSHIEALGNTATWSAPKFDDMHLPRRRRVDGELILAPRSYSERAVWVSLVCGGGFFVSLNDSGLSEPIEVLDPEQRTLVRHRIALESSDYDDDATPLLGESMPVLIAVHRQVARAHISDILDKLRRWKGHLANRLHRYGAPAVARELLQTYPAFQDYANLPANLNRWAKRGDEINAPGHVEAFRSLVRDYLSMRHGNEEEEQRSPWWQQAWIEIEGYRIRNMEVGQRLRTQIDSTITHYIQQNWDKIMSALEMSGSYTLNIEGAQKSIIARVSDVDYGPDDQGVAVGEDKCGKYFEPEEKPEEEE